MGYTICCKFVKYWKLYTNEEQTTRFLEAQRQKRKLKIKNLISSVKTKMSETNESNIKNAKALTDIPTKKKKQEIKTKTKQITSHNISIQTDTENKTESVNVVKQLKSQRKAKVMPPIKPSKLII